MGHRLRMVHRAVHRAFFKPSWQAAPLLGGGGTGQYVYETDFKSQFGFIGTGVPFADFNAFTGKPITQIQQVPTAGIPPQYIGVQLQGLYDPNSIPKG